jgi:hypothetical protein
MVSVRRPASSLVVAFVLAATLVFGVAAPGYAWGPTPAPTMVQGGSARFGMGVFGKAVGGVVPAVGLGLLAWGAYNFYVDMTTLDASGAVDGGCHLTPFNDVVGQICTQLLGTQANNYVIAYQATISNNQLTTQNVHLQVRWTFVRPGGATSTCAWRTAVGPVAAGASGTINAVRSTGSDTGAYCSPSGAGEGHPVQPLDATIRVGTGTIGDDKSWSSSDTSYGPITFNWADTAQSNLTKTPAEYTVTTELDCFNNQTGTTTKVLVDQTVFVTPEGSFPSAPAACPTGTTISYGRVRAAPRPGTTGPTRDLFEWEQDQGLLVPAPSPWQDCLYPAGSPCVLRVEKTADFTVTDPEWQACSTAFGNCTDWWWEADRDLRYRCMWGVYVLPAEQCRDLAYAYRTGTSGQVAPNPELVPPTSGQTSPQPTTPSAPTTSPTAPSTTPGTGTGTGTITFPDPTPGPEHGDTSCWSGMAIGWNPVSWVLEPTKCALQWAFVPSTTTVTSLQTVGDQFSSKAPVSYAVAASEWVDTFSNGGSSCLVLAPTIYGQSYPVVDSCTPDPVSGQIMAMRPLLTVAVWGLFALPLAWWAWRQYAPGSQGSA